MKSSNDWQEALRALQSTLPEGDNEQESQKAEEEHSSRPALRLKVEVDRKRRGKIATIISGFDANDPQLDEIAATLKKRLATGGSCRDGEILVQGDRADEVKALLKSMGLMK